MTLMCAVCSKEVGIVRLNRETMTFGHRSNPGLASHPVRLARSSSDAHPGVSHATIEAPDTLRGHAAVPGASLRPALVSGTGSEGAHALTASMPVDLQLSRERASQPAGTPSIGTPRAPVTVGRSDIAGEA